MAGSKNTLIIGVSQDLDGATFWLPEEHNGFTGTTRKIYVDVSSSGYLTDPNYSSLFKFKAIAEILTGVSTNHWSSFQVVRVTDTGEYELVLEVPNQSLRMESRRP